MFVFTNFYDHRLWSFHLHLQRFSILTRKLCDLSNIKVVQTEACGVTRVRRLVSESQEKNGMNANNKSSV